MNASSEPRQKMAQSPATDHEQASITVGPGPCRIPIHPPHTFPRRRGPQGSVRLRALQSHVPHILAWHLPWLWRRHLHHYHPFRPNRPVSWRAWVASGRLCSLCSYAVATRFRRSAQDENTPWSDRILGVLGGSLGYIYCRSRGLHGIAFIRGSQLALCSFPTTWRSDYSYPCVPPCRMRRLLHTSRTLTFLILPKGR